MQQQKTLFTLKLVSKELNHFGAIAAFFGIGHKGHWQVAHKLSFMHHWQPVPQTRKMLQLAQSYLTQFTVFAGDFVDNT
jgi:hypothetical protein